jgi:Lipocalin-like domain
MRAVVLILFAISRVLFATEPDGLVSVWKLVSFQTVIENGSPQNEFGVHPKGFLILTREGRSMVLITAERRRGGTNDSDRAALHRSMVSYSGKYRVQGGDLIIRVDASWNEEWNGTEQRRHFRIEGDKLFIESAPGPSILHPGKTAFGKLVWEREK